MSIDLEIQIASNVKTMPHPAQVKEWISVALWDRLDNSELTIRIVDEEESAKLNNDYRQINKATNVLSFPIETDSEMDFNNIGDIVICAPIVEKEAAEQNKELLSHWAHMVVHGALHLLGYEHETDEDAEEMEGIETEILIKLGFPPPYGEHEE